LFNTWKSLGLIELAAVFQLFSISLDSGIRRRTSQLKSHPS
jgi:hypothetical protein